MEEKRRSSQAAPEKVAEAELRKERSRKRDLKVKKMRRT